MAREAKNVWFPLEIERNYTLINTVGEYVRTLIITERGSDGTTNVSHTINTTVRDIENPNIINFSGKSSLKIWNAGYQIPELSTTQNDIQVIGNDISGWITGPGKLRIFDGINEETVNYTSIDIANNMIRGVAARTRTYKNYSSINMIGKTISKLTNITRGYKGTTATSHNVGSIVEKDTPRTTLQDNISSSETTYIILNDGYEFPATGNLVVNDEEIYYRMLGRYLLTTGVNETLGVVENSIFAFDTLRNQLAGTTSNSQQILMIDSSKFSQRGTVTIDQEQIRYTGNTNTALTGLTRAVNGTTIASHVVGSLVTENKSTNTTQAVSSTETNTISIWDNSRYSYKGIIKIDNELIRYESITLKRVCVLAKVNNNNLVLTLNIAF